MKRLFEILFGLDKGFLSRPGELHPQFNPKWPGQEFLDHLFQQMGWTSYHGMGAVLWNVLLGLIVLMLVVYVYRREGRGQLARVVLATMRLALLVFVLVMLNRPVLVLTNVQEEPSVVAVLVDDSISMKVPDALPNAVPGTQLIRLDAVKDLINGQNQKLIHDLARKHILRFYHFSGTSKSLPTVAVDDTRKTPAKKPATLPTTMRSTELQAAITALKPEGQSTQIGDAIKQVLDELQGLRLAGIVLMTDGRDTPAESLGEAISSIKGHQVPVFAVPVGSNQPVQNLAIERVTAEPDAFVGDIVSVNLTIRGRGLPRGFTTRVTLEDRKTHQPLKMPDGKIAELPLRFDDDKPQDVEIPFKPDAVGMQDIVAKIPVLDGELEVEDNAREFQVDVLDAKINVLYVDGYPRWEYRYITREMMRDKTMRISTLLMSADAGVAQEHSVMDDAESQKFKYFPYKSFPTTMQEMMDCDCIVFGDVDPRLFTDAQLQLISDFVAKKGGGFGMVSGPRWAPVAYRGTPIAAVLPVSIEHAAPDDNTASITTGFRPALTRDGSASSIFRFFVDKAANEKYLKEDLQPLFWYSRGVTVKQGVGEVLAEHPNDLGPDGRKAPVLVTGKFAAGRTLFSAYDDSWRWRYYTGEQVFDTYWVQQLRYLSRSKKLGQRKFTLTSERPVYERRPDQQVKVTARILDTELLQQLPDQISVDIRDEKGNLVRRESMLRGEGVNNDQFIVTLPADMVGKFTVRPTGVGNGLEALESSFTIAEPRLELDQPEVDMTLLTQLAGAAPGGKIVPLAEARESLPKLIVSRSRELEIRNPMPIWDAPLGMILFVLLITVEWVLRKVYGLL